MNLSIRFIGFCCALLISSSALAQAPVAEVITLRNYDISKPATFIEAPGVQGDQAYTGLGERFTLSGSSGYLDSIRIHFDSVSGDILQIGVFRDEIRETSRGTFHLADYSIFGLIQRYELDISPFEGMRDFWVTIPTDHLPVPKEFHIGVGANPLTQGSDEYTSMFRLMGEAHYNQQPTIDSRSIILVTEDFVNFRTEIFDGYFTFNTLPLGINFHIDAVVDQEPSSVVVREAKALSVYPNPIRSGGELQLANAGAHSSVTLYDVLGNKVAHWDNADQRLSLPRLSAGVYSLVISGALDMLSQRIIIE